MKMQKSSDTPNHHCTPTPVISPDLLRTTVEFKVELVSRNFLRPSSNPSEDPRIADH